MTKADMTRFLEPFTDDIKIVVYGSRVHSFMLETAEAIYCVGKEDTGALSRENIEPGEGYILIKED